MLRALLASLVVLTGILAPQRAAVDGDTAAPPDTGDTAPLGETAETGTPTETGDSAAGADTADTATDPGEGIVDLSGEPGGCGCASGGTSLSPTLALLAAAALLVRRGNR